MRRRRKKSLKSQLCVRVGYESRLQSSWTHYSESELCGGVVTVSFSKYLPWQRRTSYNAPLTSRKRSYGRFKRTIFRVAEQL
jgi:hypothetical protein